MIKASSTPLRPRRVLAKEALLQPPGKVHRLLVKFTDNFQARSVEAGRLSIISSQRQDALAEVIRTHRLVFTRLQTTTDEQISSLRERAERLSGNEQPDLLGQLSATPHEATPEKVWQAAKALHNLSQVEFISIESLDAPPPPPATDIAPTSELLTSFQGYRTATGINVDYAWTQYGAKGAGVKVTDCEYYYNADHEDLSGLVAPQPGTISYYTGFGTDHATAVLGVLASGENSYGMTGTIPQSTVRFYPEYSTVNGTFQSRPTAVTAAIAASVPGDVVLLEMQTAGPAGGTNFGPAEYEQAVWTAVKMGTDAGVIVVGAAGNGSLNLDDSSFSEYRARGDSGAILVGAGSSSQARLSYSTYGSRIDLQAWGQGVATTGYGDLRKYGSDVNQGYTAGFSGTSSASPIVTSAVVLAQSVALVRLSRPLTPLEVRQLLVETGKPQAGSLSQPIGPLPNLTNALPLLMTRFKPAMTTLAVYGRYFFDTPTVDLQADVERDGLPNLVEYFLGTDPLTETAVDRARVPQFNRFTNNGVSGMQYQFSRNTSATDVTWRVEITESLTNNVWQPQTNGVGGVVINDNAGQVSVFIPQQANQRQLFARLVVSK